MRRVPIRAAATILAMSGAFACAPADAAKCKDGAQVTITGVLGEPHLGDKTTKSILYTAASTKPCEVDAVDGPSGIWPAECAVGRKFTATGTVTTTHSMALNPLVATRILCK